MHPHRVPTRGPQRAEHRAAHESARALAAAESDVEVDVDVVVLTGADPAFCAGLDLNELAARGTNLAGGSGDPGGDERWINPVEAVWAMTKPVIGAINGACVTGGLELALGCDFLVASERAFFGTNYERLRTIKTKWDPHEVFHFEQSIPPA